MLTANVSFVIGQIGPTTQIFGGEDTDISNFPYQVSLETPNGGCIGGHICGGSIVNAEWILTAAHCVDFISIPQDITVHAGSTDQTDDGVGQRIAVNEIRIHPGWNGDFTETGNDIALLHLSQPLCFNQNIQTVAIDSPDNSDDLIAVGESASIFAELINGSSVIHHDRIIVLK